MERYLANVYMNLDYKISQLLEKKPTEKNKQKLDKLFEDRDAVLIKWKKELENAK